MELTVNTIFCFCSNITTNTTFLIQNHKNNTLYRGTWDEMPDKYNLASVMYFEINKNDTVRIVLLGA